MRVKCLGRVTPPHDVQVITAVPRPDYHDNKPEQEPYNPQYLELGSKRYSSGEIIQSKDLNEKFIKKSKKEPQRIYEISNKQSKFTIGGWLWLYNEKVYELDRNDYKPEQVKLLILDLLEKESEYFKKLKRKYTS